MCALPSRFIKKCNKVSTTSAYCHEHQHTRHGWFQDGWFQDGWLWRGSAEKQTRPEKKAEAERKWRNHQKVRGDDVKRWLAKQWQRMANTLFVRDHFRQLGDDTLYLHVRGHPHHRSQIIEFFLAQVISLSLSLSRHLSFSPVKLQTSHIIHMLPKHTLHYMWMCVLLHN